MPSVDLYRKSKFMRQHSITDGEISVIGRGATCDIVLPDSHRRVSRTHAALVPLQSPAGWLVRDLGSLYGTRINGTSIQRRVLQAGDSIEIGNYRLVFLLETGTPAGFQHLRVVGSTPGPLSSTGEPMTPRTARVSRQVPMDPSREELLEEMERRSANRSVVLDSASEIMTSIVRTIGADKGFMGFFSDDERPHKEYGVVNLRKDESIEISNSNFVSQLLKGESVHEGTTLLVPVARLNQVKGFFCVSRSSRCKSFSMEDESYLRALGRVMVTSSDMGSHSSPLKEPTDEVYVWPVEIIGRSEPMRQLHEAARHGAASDTNVLILGETGSGKELVARAIHSHSPHLKGLFLARNCSQITETLAEAEIFGYDAQSGIAGANPRGSPGWFEMANGGTLFLDEIHRLTPAMQDKFLRVLQDKQVWRIGAKRPTQVAVKVIAATDEDPYAKNKETWCRAPFLYRFGLTIRVPSLRSRKGDIPLLAFYFLDKYAQATGSKSRSISHRAVRDLVDYDWPGNVRQLEQEIHSGVVRNNEVLFTWDFNLAGTDSRSENETHCIEGGPLRKSRVTDKGIPRTMEQVEKEYIKEVLEVTQGNITQAARLLGYKSRQTILNKMDRYAIERHYVDSSVRKPGGRV
jgi:DNA-binding NtrC family response regulator/pSer/pThr/pTyr-binding forkhead associated (FHA) protein